MQATIRHLATAFIAGAAIAFAADVILQVLSTAVRITDGAGLAWSARAAATGGWLVLGALVWITAPLIAGTLEAFPTAPAPRRTVWAGVGTALLFLPPLIVAAQLIVAHVIVGAFQFAVAGAWSPDSELLISGAFWGAVLMFVTPWMAAGAILRAWAAHLID